MCGIGGCLGEHATSELMKKMSEITKHRGPDDYGEFIDRKIGIFSNRLSIIDIAGGHQPIFSEDENLVIVYNGEIYNFPELREELEKKGHHFRTKSDTEVIVIGFKEYGTMIFSKLNGMFAFALWDRKESRLYLVRDRVGIKPLFFTKAQSGDLVFCSEVKGILCHPEIRAKVDREALYEIIALYYVPFERTLFEGIYKIPPGHYYDSLEGQVIRYWTPPLPREKYLPSIAQVRNALEESIRAQLISDVEVGSFLSGGLDSSTIVAFASKHYTGKLKTFCMGFGHENDELEDAKLVAEHFGTDHKSFTITDRSALELYPRMIWHSEQPKLNTYSWFVNEMASEYVKVCLSGLGGDELFFGYANSSRFENFRNAEKLMKVPGASLVSKFVGGRRSEVLSSIRNRAATYLSTVSPIYGKSDSKYFTKPVDEYRKSLTDKIEEIFFETKSDFVQQAFDAELETKLPNDFLSIDDSMCMAHSLENRVPLLDNRMIDLIRPVPYSYNYVNGEGKYLLRQAMKGLLPDSCFAKPKQGFSLDVTKWWRGELGEEIRRVIPESNTVKQYFSIDLIKSMIPDARDSYSKVSLLWGVYAFHVWHEIFVERAGSNLAYSSIPAHVRN